MLFWNINFIWKFRQQLVLQKEATIRRIFVNKKLFTFVPTDDLIWPWMLGVSAEYGLDSIRCNIRKSLLL